MTPENPAGLRDDALEAFLDARQPRKDWGIRDEVAYIAAIHRDNHGVWTPKEWRSFVLAADMLDWTRLLAALAATPDPAGLGEALRWLWQTKRITLTDDPRVLAAEYAARLRDTGSGT